MVETFEKIGDALGVVWAFFESESGDLTVFGCLLLATLAGATAFQCFRAMQPAFDEKLTNVVAIGSAMAATFAAVGVFFLYRAIAALTG